MVLSRTSFVQRFGGETGAGSSTAVEHLGRQAGPPRLPKAAKRFLGIPGPGATVPRVELGPTACAFFLWYAGDVPGSGDATAGIARAERRLATILAADVVGYSHLIEQDEDGTLSALKELRRAVIAPCLAGHYGRIVKLMGDGAIVDLGSVVDAVRCANLIQTGVAEIATAGQEAAKRKHAARCLEPAPADLGDLGQRELRIEEHSNSGRAGSR